MVTNGDNLNIPRDIDFQIVTPNGDAAEKLAAMIRSWGYNAIVHFPGCVPALPWEVHVVRHMLPTHEGITRFEDELSRAASTVGGRNDGWGCFNVKAN
jgi:hypothetical protein